MNRTTMKATANGFCSNCGRDGLVAIVGTVCQLCEGCIERANERAATLKADPGVWCQCKAPHFRNAQECDKCGGYVRDAAARCDKFRASSLCAGEFAYITCGACGQHVVFIRCAKHGGEAGARRSLHSHSALTHPAPSTGKGGR